MSETPVQTNGGQEQKKWQTLSAFMMNLSSKQFYITLAIIVFEAVVIYFGLHLPDKVTMSEYVGLVGVVHGFLMVVITFWFTNDQKSREMQNKNGGSN